MNLLKKFLILLACVNLFSACEYYIKDEAQTNSLDPSILASENLAPLENEAEPIETKPASETEALTHKIIATMTLQESSFIAEKMDEYDIEISSLEISRDHIYFIYSVDPQTQELVKKMKQVNYRWGIDKNNEDLGKMLQLSRELKVRIATLLTILAPEHEFEQPEDDGIFGADFSKKVPLFGVILDILIEALEQISLAISYNIDGECKSFFYYANPVLEDEQERGYLNFIDCKDNQFLDK